MVRPLQVPNPKVFLIINAGVNGWTESHMYTSAVPLSDANLLNFAFRLAQARCKALDGINAKLFDCRVSLDDVNRDSKHIDISTLVPSPTTGYASFGGPSNNATVWNYQTVQVSWPAILTTSNSTTNPIEYLAGMPASVGQFGNMPNMSTPPNAQQYLAAYLDELCSGSWGALGRAWSGVNYPVGTILWTAASGSTPNTFKFTLGGPPYPAGSVFPIGSYIRLQGATYSTPQARLRLNGTYTVAAYNPTTGILTVNVPRVIVDPVFYTTGGIEPATAAVFPYNGYTFRPITHRKRGRPFGAGRGRR